MLGRGPSGTHVSMGRFECHVPFGPGSPLRCIALALGLLGAVSLVSVPGSAQCPAGYDVSCGDGTCCTSSHPVCCPGGGCCPSGTTCSGGSCLTSDPGCPSGETPCGTGCMPSGAVCCTSYYCDAGEFCDSGGCSSGSSGGGCGYGQVSCGDGCIPGSAVCCTGAGYPGYYCDAGEICTSDGQCQSGGSGGSSGASSSSSGGGGASGSSGTPPPPPRSVCEDTCRWSADGVCDDGGPHAEFGVCPYGTDCTDCGPRRQDGFGCQAAGGSSQASPAVPLALLLLSLWLVVRRVEGRTR